jgi:glycosyltransferase involved in cell wall biosynthesis
VTLCAWMPQHALIEIVDQHGIFLFPSFFEGFGKAPLEAMSRGLCVVASRTGGMRDFIEDGQTGRLVPIGEPDTMAACVLELLDDRPRCQQMSSLARASAIRHRWETCAVDLVGHYRRWLATKSAGTKSAR